MQQEVDWEAIEASPEFRALVAAKRKFVAPRIVFFLGWYIAFVLLAGYAEDFMNERVYEGLTLGYVLALSQFVMVWFLVWEYLRKARADFEPLEQAVRDKYDPPREATGRFKRETADETADDAVRTTS